MQANLEIKEKDVDALLTAHNHLDMENLALRNEMISNPIIGDSFRLCRMHEVAQLFYKESLTRMMTLVNALRRWRRHIVLGRRYAQIVQSRNERKAAYLQGFTFVAIKRYSRRRHLQKLAELRLKSALEARFLIAWHQAYKRNASISAFMKTRVMLKSRTFFYLLSKRLKKKRRQLRRDAKLDALVTCFTVIRAFGAWKKLSLRNNHVLSVLPDAHSLARAHFHFLRRTFTAWRSHTDKKRSHNRSIGNIIYSIQSRRTLSLSFLFWRAAYSAAAHWKRQSSLRVLKALLRSSTSMPRTRYCEDHALSFYCDWRLRNSIYSWFGFTRSRIAFRSKDIRIKSLLMYRQNRKAFLKWRSTASYKANILKRSSDAISLYFRSLLKTPFYAWAQVCRETKIRKVEIEKQVPPPYSMQQSLQGMQESDFHSDEGESDDAENKNFDGHALYLRVCLRK